jgi:hypothetical protein
MNQPSFRPQPIRDFIGGFLLVPVLHTLFVMGLMLFSQITHQIFSKILLILLFGMSLSQFLYVAPVIFYFWARDRLEVIKGLLVATFLTILASGSCAAAFGPPTAEYFGVDQLTLLLMAGLSITIGITLIFYIFKPRL